MKLLAISYVIGVASIVTPLYNYVVPLIRYDRADSTVVGAAGLH